MSNNGIGIYIPEVDFSDKKVDLVNILTSDLKDSIKLYGKAIMLGKDVNFDQANFGQVPILDIVPLNHIDIYIYDKYWNAEKQQFHINGKGTVAVATLYPNVSQFVHYGVAWTILEGNEYVKINKVQQKVTTNSSISNVFSNSCYIEIKKGVCNKKVTIECYSLSSLYSNAHGTVTFYVTYDESAVTDELGFFDIEVNNSYNREKVFSDKIEILIHYFPKSARSRSGFFDFNSIYYSNEVIEAETSEDERERLKKKMNIWEDLINSAVIEDNYYIKKTDEYVTRCTMTIPHCWLEDMMFYCKFYCTTPLSYSNVKIFQEIEFPFGYTNHNAFNLDYNLNGNLGYVPLSSKDFLIYTDIYRNNSVSYTPENDINRLWFQHLGQTPKILTTNIYSIEAKVKEITDSEDFIIISCITKSIEENEIHTYKGHVSLLKHYGSVIYDVNTSRFYLIYDNIIYYYVDSFHSITDNTYAYYNSSIFKIEKTSNLTYSLSSIYEEENQKNNYSSFDIVINKPEKYSQMSVGGNPIHSETIRSYNDIITNDLKCRNSNTIGLDNNSFQVIDCNPFYVEGKKLNKIFGLSLLTFGKVVLFYREKEIKIEMPTIEANAARTFVNISTFLKNYHIVYRFIKLERIIENETEKYIDGDVVKEWSTEYSSEILILLSTMKLVPETMYAIEAYSRLNQKRSEVARLTILYFKQSSEGGGGDGGSEGGDGSEEIPPSNVIFILQQDKTNPWSFYIQLFNNRYKYVKYVYSVLFVESNLNNVEDYEVVRETGEDTYFSPKFSMKTTKDIATITVNAYDENGLLLKILDATPTDSNELEDTSENPQLVKTLTISVSYQLTPPTIVLNGNTVSIINAHKGIPLYYRFYQNQQYTSSDNESVTITLKRRQKFNILAYTIRNEERSSTQTAYVEYIASAEEDSTNNGIFDDRTLSTQSFNEDSENTENILQYIDLGFSSGTKWANMNVGANSIEDVGLYFQYGNPQGHSAEETYNYSKIETDYEYIPLGDYTDMATVNLGNEWICPTKEQIRELADNTITSFETIGTQRVIRFISKINNKSIVIPCGGVMEGLGSKDKDFKCYFWSKDITERANAIYNGKFSQYDGDVDITDEYYLGMNVRAVYNDGGLVMGNNFLSENGIREEYSDEVELCELPFSDKIYVNYGFVNGEQEDIAEYTSKYQLEQAVLHGKISGNLITGSIFNFIIYTKDNIFDRYTYYKDYPQTLSDLIRMRNVAEIDLRRDERGNIVNVGWGSQPIFTDLNNHNK